MKKKYKIMTAENAVKEGLIKEGDYIWVNCKVKKIHKTGIQDNFGRYFENTKIRIPIPKPKPIDFGEAGRVLRYDYDGTTFIVKTTGFKRQSDEFSAFVIEEGNSPWYKGEVANDFTTSSSWTDITDTYNL